MLCRGNHHPKINLRSSLNNSTIPRMPSDIFTTDFSYQNFSSALNFNEFFLLLPTKAFPYGKSLSASRERNESQGNKARNQHDQHS